MFSCHVMRHLGFCNFRECFCRFVDIKYVFNYPKYVDQFPQYIHSDSNYFYTYFCTIPQLHVVQRHVVIKIQPGTN